MQILRGGFMSTDSQFLPGMFRCLAILLLVTSQAQAQFHDPRALEVNSRRYPDGGWRRDSGREHWGLLPPGVLWLLAGYRSYH